MGRNPLRGIPAAAIMITLATGAGEVRAQNDAGLSRELDLLREAASLEADGRFAEAERVVARVLEADPGSLTALLQMERILLVQGRAEHLLPVVDRLIEIDATSAVAHQIKVRALSLLDRPGDLRKAGEAWIAATPGIEVPYRELARVWEQRGERHFAIGLLERGRRSVARDDALALELGEAYAAIRRNGEAAAAWARAIGPQARGLHAVERRLRILPDGGAGVLPGLVAALDRSNASIPQLRAAAVLAIDAGLADRAVKVSERAEQQLTAATRRSFLVEIARRADGAGLPRVAYHAYRGLAAEPADGEGQRWAIHARLADLALEVGDTAEASRLYGELERAFARGSAERRTALAARVRISARENETRAAVEAFEGFRTEFPDAPETDRLAALVATALMLSDDGEAAESVLDGVRGPATSRVRGWLAVSRGDLVRARTHLLAAAAGLHGEEGTQAIGLAVLLERVSADGGEMVAGMLAAGPPDEDAMAALISRSAPLPPAERAAILDFAAAVSETAGRTEQASEIRRTIVEEHPQAPEAPGALLALARGMSDRAGFGAEVRVLLEKLIVDYPRSALVPQARRELERLVASSAPR